MKCEKCGAEMYEDGDANEEYPFEEWRAWLCPTDGCDYQVPIIEEKS